MILLAAAFARTLATAAAFGSAVALAVFGPDPDEGLACGRDHVGDVHATEGRGVPGLAVFVLEALGEGSGVVDPVGTPFVLPECSVAVGLRRAVRLRRLYLT